MPKEETKKPAHELIQEFLNKEDIVMVPQPVLVQRDDGHWDIQVQILAEYRKVVQEAK